MKNDYSLIENCFFLPVYQFSAISSFDVHFQPMAIYRVCTPWHLNNDDEKDTLCKAQFFERCIMYSEDTLSNVSNVSLFADT